MKHIQKTNAIRIVEAMNIPFDTGTYDPGDEHVDAGTIARQMGVPAEMVFKTLVTRDDKNNILVFCIPANAELDLKKGANACGAKNISLIKLDELFGLTGYVRGGCSPLGMKKKYPVFVDETASLFERIYVNAGMRGLQIVLSPVDLVRACEGKLVELT
jgi:Cys-tRNA(Pro)/Cys-tRNA(Cys) deacylase